MKLFFKLVIIIFSYGFYIEPVYRSVLGIYISEERNMLIAEKFIQISSDQILKNIQYILMVEHGMMKYVIFSD